MRIRASMLMFGIALAGLGCNERGGTDAGPTCTSTGPENSAGACTDGLDNDCSGRSDCNDLACCDLTTCGPTTACGGAAQDAGSCIATGAEETSAAACADGVDNDCNGFTDCRDFSCGDVCGAENSNAGCNDGMDNDMDGRVDCMDFDCDDFSVCSDEITNAACSDGMDNDSDSMMDCADPDCIDEGVVVCDALGDASDIAATPAAWAAAVETACSNDVEDGEDTDMLFDCGEFSCLWNQSSCMRVFEGNSNAECSDGLDNDQDGVIDCNEGECQVEGIVVCNGTTPVVVAPGDFTTMANARCGDGISNDTRPEVDCADFGCSRVQEVTACTTQENSNERCSDGTSNDGDDFVDCRDIDCIQNRFVTVCENSYERCSDGMDNDGDHIPDCADYDCTPESGAPNPACFGLPPPP